MSDEKENLAVAIWHIVNPPYFCSDIPIRRHEMGVDLISQARTLR